MQWQVPAEQQELNRAVLVSGLDLSRRIYAVSSVSLSLCDLLGISSVAFL